MGSPHHLSKLVRQLSQDSTRRILDDLSRMSALHEQIQRQILPITRITIPLTEQFSSFTKALDQSREIYRIVGSATETVRAQLVSAMSSMDIVSRSIAADFAATRIAFENLISSDILDRFRERLQLDEETVEAFNEAGWPIAPSMPISIRKRVVQLHKKGKARYASQTILGHYRREDHLYLREAVKRWESNTLFAPRMHIIFDALNAHCQGLYTLSVPTLLPQVEGVLNDYVKLVGLPARYGKINDVYAAAIGAPHDYSLSTWSIARTLLYHLQNSTYAYTDFEEELRKALTRRRTTRHTVLHGVAIKYDRPIHSLRILVMLDALSALELTLQDPS